MSIVSDIVNGNLTLAREAIMTSNNPAYTVLTTAKSLLRGTNADPQLLLSTLRDLVADQ